MPTGVVGNLVNSGSGGGVFLPVLVRGDQDLGKLRHGSIDIAEDPSISRLRRHLGIRQHVVGASKLLGDLTLRLAGEAPEEDDMAREEAEGVVAR